MAVAHVPARLSIPGAAGPELISHASVLEPPCPHRCIVVHCDPLYITLCLCVASPPPAATPAHTQQKTNKSFNARRWCGNRTYEYYLPASTLELDTPDGSSDGDRAKLALLREVLQAFCGYRPYQNYAGNRSQYVGQKEKGGFAGRVLKKM